MTDSNPADRISEPAPSYSVAPGGPAVRTNVLAIVSIVTAFIAPIAAIITGHLALSQIRRTGEEGYGLAKAGLIVGYVFSAFAVVFFIVWLSLFVSILNSGPMR